MMDADLLCDRVAFIADGNIKALGAPWKLKRENSSHLQEPTLEDVYMKYTREGAGMMRRIFCSLLKRTSD